MILHLATFPSFALEGPEISSWRAATKARHRQAGTTTNDHPAEKPVPPALIRKDSRKYHSINMHQSRGSPWKLDLLGRGTRHHSAAIRQAPNPRRSYLAVAQQRHVQHEPCYDLLVVLAGARLLAQHGSIALHIMQIAVCRPAVEYTAGRADNRNGDWHLKAPLKSETRSMAR